MKRTLAFGAMTAVVISIAGCTGATGDGRDANQADVTADDGDVTYDDWGGDEEEIQDVYGPAPVR